MVQRYCVDCEHLTEADEKVILAYPVYIYVSNIDYAALEREKEELAKKVKELEAENAALRKRLEPIEEWWDRSNEYIRNQHKHWDASMYEAIEKCMELKEGE